MTPVIGITSTHASPEWIANNTQRYLDAVRAAGGEPLVLAPETYAPELFERLDALLLSGGGDIDPPAYGAENAGSEEIEPARDALELPLARAALERDLPVLGICRGFQVLNVALGGALLQDLPGHRGALRPDGHHANAPHRVELLPSAPRLAALFGTGPAAINSYHHQAVTPAMLAAGLIAGASSDGIVEAFEVPGRHWAVAVQWHPERYAVDAATFSDVQRQRRLFAEFVAAAGREPA